MKKLGRPISLAGKPTRGTIESFAKKDWSDYTIVVLKRAMLARRWRYEELSEGLKCIGITRSAAILNRRINRGNFSAGFFLACLEVMKVEFDIRLGDADQNQPANFGLSE